MRGSSGSCRRAFPWVCSITSWPSSGRVCPRSPGKASLYCTYFSPAPLPFSVGLGARQPDEPDRQDRNHQCPNANCPAAKGTSRVLLRCHKKKRSQEHQAQERETGNPALPIGRCGAIAVALRLEPILRHPTEPSRDTPISFCVSAMNSIGSCCSTSRTKPLTISATASSADRPRCRQ